ncbi:hypothetical protein RJ639_036567 [Escallonia herrerae]|uniref:Uncharacterized protein n=1 Tax=Escallonia herrerae TaxID=1293975 RepID=A0AA89B8M3_9ASTE|nr:hypothetical protein RJ639_036567 [Escallonia herrerae]
MISYFTRFKCGGLSLGLSWAHILGDAFSASAFINLWGEIAADHFPTQPLNTPDTGKLQFPSPEKPFSMKKVDPVGDYWLATNSCKMGTHSIHWQAEQLNHFLSKSCGISQTAKLLPFEILSAIMWKSLAKIRGTSEPRVVTIFGKDDFEAESGRGKYDRGLDGEREWKLGFYCIRGKLNVREFGRGEDLWARIEWTETNFRKLHYRWGWRGRGCFGSSGT